MRIKPVLSVLGFLIAIVGALMLTALPFSLYFGDTDVTPILHSSLITMLTGGVIWLTFRRFEGELRVREGFAIVTLGWASIALFGSLPFYLSDAIPVFTDAYFESISGLTTTGASILTDVESLPHGVLYWRSFTHWIGGMGIILLSVAILPLLGVGGMELFKAEAPGIVVDKLSPRVSGTAKILWGVYIVMTVVQTGLLWYGGMTFFDALCHSYGTVATGGYSTKNASIAYYDSPFLQYVIITFMFIAGTSFTLHFRALRGEWNSYARDNEFVFYTLTVLVASVIIMIVLPSGAAESWEERIRISLFQVVSIITTTGYVTADYELWVPMAQLTLLLLMFNGGSAGSTAGGMKIVRVMLLLKNGLVEIKRAIHPKAIMPVRFNGHSVSSGIIGEIMAFFVLYITIFVIASLAMTAVGLDLLSAIGSVASALGNVGPALGSVGPIDNYAHVSEAGKWILAFCMLVGRLEIFTVFVLFSRAFWRA